MGKKWAGNAREGVQGFQKTQPKAVSPAGKRGFMSKLFGKDKPYSYPMEPDVNYPADDWGVGGGYQFEQMQAKIEEKTGSGSQTPHVPGDVTDDYRFGPHAVAHAKLDTKRQEALAGLEKSESFVWNGENGPQTVVHNFNPNNVRPAVQSLAYGVLEESGYFDRGTPKYRGVSNVYSKETIRCAERVYLAQNDVFQDQRHPKESTSMFPCEVNKTPEKISYQYYMHPDVSELIHGVNKDQLNHGKLQSEISEHQGRATARKSKNSNPFDLSDW